MEQPKTGGDLLSVPGATDQTSLTAEEMERQRRVSASEPLLPQAISLIQEDLRKCVTYKLPHVFVVFGASVSTFNTINNTFTTFSF